MSTRQFYARIGSAIKAEEARARSNRERGETALATWETLSPVAGMFSPSIKERGDCYAANLRGTPYFDCPRYASLLSDLEWCISKQQTNKQKPE